MKYRLLSTSLLGGAIASLTICFEAPAQTTETCFTGDEYIPIETEYRYREPEPAYIYAEDLDSNVNVRTGPGLRFEAFRTASPESYVDVTGQAFGADCATWLYVEAPLSGWAGWVRADFLGFSSPARGFWG